MAGVSLPVHRPSGRALVVASPDHRADILNLLRQWGYQTAAADNPYAAVAECASNPALYRTLIVSLQSLYREEVQLIQSLRRCLPQMEIWLADTDARPAALAQALQMGADGIVSDEGFHRLGVAAASSPPPAEPKPPGDPAPVAQPPLDANAQAEEADEEDSHPADSHPADSHPADSHEDDLHEAEHEEDPLLTPAELRALLQDPPREVNTKGE